MVYRPHILIEAGVTLAPTFSFGAKNDRHEVSGTSLISAHLSTSRQPFCSCHLIIPLP